jgi:hypothetical protein
MGLAAAKAVAGCWRPLKIGRVKNGAFADCMVELYGTCRGKQTLEPTETTHEMVSTALRTGFSVC